MDKIKENLRIMATSSWLPNSLFFCALCWLIVSDQSSNRIPEENKQILISIEKRLEQTEKIQKERNAIIDEFHKLQRDMREHKQP